MNRLKKYTLAGIFFVVILGTLSHFTYEWSGNNRIVALFCPVNESTWEHMKLCFFPMLLYALFMNRQLQEEYPCITSALLSGVIYGTFLIPVIFYTYTGILGYNLLFLDLATYLISVLLAFRAVYRLSLSCRAATFTAFLKVLTALLFLGFWIFTFFPPAIGLFVPPSAS